MIIEVYVSANSTLSPVAPKSFVTVEHDDIELFNEDEPLPEGYAYLHDQNNDGYWGPKKIKENGNSFRQAINLSKVISEV